MVLSSSRLSKARERPLTSAHTLESAKARESVRGIRVFSPAKTGRTQRKTRGAPKTVSIFGAPRVLPLVVSLSVSRSARNSTSHVAFKNEECCVLLSSSRPSRRVSGLSPPLTL